MSETRRPYLYHVDLDQAMTTLDHSDMLALADLFETWALTEENISGERRTALIQWSSDYEAIAEYSGTGWRASAPDPSSLLKYVSEWAKRRQPEK